MGVEEEGSTTAAGAGNLGSFFPLLLFGRAAFVLSSRDAAEGVAYMVMGRES
jgi:hypothetical protein